jgi:hypothetical protein
MKVRMVFSLDPISDWEDDKNSAETVVSQVLNRHRLTSLEDAEFDVCSDGYVLKLSVDGSDSDLLTTINSELKEAFVEIGMMKKAGSILSMHKLANTTPNKKWWMFWKYNNVSAVG